MSGPFRVLTSSAFEREFRKAAKGRPDLVTAVVELIVTLRDDPHNSSQQHMIKKLVGVRPGDGQWRIRWREYRLRYDIIEGDAILHSFRHRKEAY